MFETLVLNVIVKEKIYYHPNNFQNFTKLFTCEISAVKVFTDAFEGISFGFILESRHQTINGSMHFDKRQPIQLTRRRIITFGFNPDRQCLST